MPSIWWLCRDFRFDDNEALLAAVASGPVAPVFVLDQATLSQGAASRWRLEQALRVFDAAWHARTGENISVFYGQAEDILPQLATDIGARVIHQNDWPCPQQRSVQDKLRTRLEGGPTRLELYAGHLLIHPSQVKTGAGTPYKVYTPFARAVRAHGVDAPRGEAGVNLSSCARRGQSVADLNLAPDLYGGAAVLAQFALPSGEAAAFAQLEAFFDRADRYVDKRDYPDTEATSGLSEYLALGEISPRRVWAMAEFRADALSPQAAGIEKFRAEVLWREFAWHLMIDFPQLGQKSWREKWDDFPWRRDMAAAQPWFRAQTGVALVDAGLREMRVTGRMHNRVRMVVASWLTKHLLTDWRIGLAHFEDSLTDWDPASNAMNWQWVAGCGPDASPFFRIFNPIKQAETFDPDARYRRYWLHGKGADAYSKTVPRSWENIAPKSQSDIAAQLSGGRTRALEALADFNNRPDFGDDKWLRL